MDDAIRSLNRNDITQKKANSNHWLGQLDLTFDRRESGSYLRFRQHQGPFVLQKTLFPEGPDVCHGVVIHPPGGVAGGDQLLLNVSVQSGASALLTTPGAGKWYKSNQRLAKQDLIFNVERQSSLEWLPQENILFDGADVSWKAIINLEAGAIFAGWDIVCLGRQAQKENWQTGGFHQAFKIFVDSKLQWLEQANLHPSHDLLNSVIGLNGNKVMGTFLVIADQLPEELLDRCREVKATEREAVTGVTKLPSVFVARYVGNVSQAAKLYFESLREILRPWYLNRSAVRPRIWNT